MKSKPVIPESHVEQEGVARRVPLDPPAIDSRAAANDDLARLEKDEKGPNPLWVINIAMAAFFIVAALVMMFS